MKYHSTWEAIPPIKHLRELCHALGSGYRIRLFDGEQVIYRDFGNGYDLEISGMNTSSLRKKAILYLWKDANRIIKRSSMFLSGISANGLNGSVQAESKSFDLLFSGKEIIY